MAEQSARRPARRAVLAAGGLSILAAGGYLFGVRWRYYGDRIDPVTAHDAARRGDLLLIDIRTPEEWAATGVGQSATPLDMRIPDFVTRLDALVGGQRSRPVALICARGVRSARLAKALTEAGFTQIIDVPEGMMGSFAGPGWLARALPVTGA